VFIVCRGTNLLLRNSAWLPVRVTVRRIKYHGLCNARGPNTRRNVGVSSLLCPVWGYYRRPVSSWTSLPLTHGNPSVSHVTSDNEHQGCQKRSAYCVFSVDLINTRICTPLGTHTFFRGVKMNPRFSNLVSTQPRTKQPVPQNLQRNY